MSITPLDIDVIRTGSRTARVKQLSAARAHPASDVVQWFLDYYWIRHPISDATVAAYRTDLLALDRWLSVFRSSTLLTATGKDLRAYFDDSYRARARQPGNTPSLSCIKRFYFYLAEVGLRDDDPTERVFVRTPLLKEPRAASACASNVFPVSAEFPH